jgi:hypothetical protein
MQACVSYLEVDVLQPTHHNPVQDFLVEVELGALLQGLRIHQCPDQSCVEGSLVCQAVHILGGVGIDVLERTSELVVEPLNEGGNASGDPEDLFRGDGRQLLIVFPLLGVLDDNNVLVGLQNLEKLGEIALGTIRMLAEFPNFPAE